MAVTRKLKRSEAPKDKKIRKPPSKPTVTETTAVEKKIRKRASKPTVTETTAVEKKIRKPPSKPTVTETTVVEKKIRKPPSKPTVTEKTVVEKKIRKRPSKPTVTETTVVEKKIRKRPSKPSVTETTVVEKKIRKRPSKPTVTETTVVEKKIRKRPSKPTGTDTTAVEKKTPKKRYVQIKSADGKTKWKKSKASIFKATELNRGVVYFSNIPHGFYEKELRTYCTQFGAVTGVYIPRSDTGNSKGFGFVEFKYPEVAEVVAETMNNYLMFKRLIKAKVVPLEEQRPWIFLNRKDPVTRARQKKEVAYSARQRRLTLEEENAYKKRAETRVQRLRNKLKEKGLNYEFEVSS